MKNFKRKEVKGFTIIELVVVIAVIAILAAVLIPTFSNLVKKANMSADMQVVKNMNTALTTDEIINGKPSTVVEAQEVLIANGISNFNTHDNNNVYYWVGIENRVILWDKVELEVTYPEEYAKQFKDLTSPSVDWSDLSENLEIIKVIESDGQTLEEAFMSSISNASVSKNNYLLLPENSTLTLSASQIGAFNSAVSEGDIAKNIHIDLNGGTINAERQDTIFAVPDGGNIEFVNGKMNVISTNYNHAGFQVGTGGSLTLRNVDVNGLGFAFLFPSSKASEIIIDNSKIKCDAYYGLMTNGMTSDNIRLVITNSEIENIGGIGVLVNCGSSVYVENSYIIGSEHGLIMRAGKATVIDSIIETTAETAGIFKYDSFTHKKESLTIGGVAIGQETYVWFTGNGIPGAVLVLGDYSAKDSSYPDPVICEMSNVTLKSANTNEIPYVLVAARANKEVTFNYTNCNISNIEMYNYMIPEFFGSITINGEAKTLN